MTAAARERSQVRTPILFVSAAAWILLAAAPRGAVLAAHCPVPMPGAALSRASLNMLLSMNPPGAWASGWALMLAAMMGPMLIAPVRHVRDRSLARRRGRSIALFVGAYAAVWLPAGAALTLLAFVARLLAPEWAAISAAAIAALVWQLSPLKQLSLNRCHAHPELAAFGKAADFDALRFGWEHGTWCALSCWALMLLPLEFSHGHSITMLAVSLWLVAERLERPETPRWRFRAPMKAARIVAARTERLAPAVAR